MKKTKKNDADWIGSMRGTMEILGDIVSPVMDDNDWEAARDEEPSHTDPVE